MAVMDQGIKVLKESLVTPTILPNLFVIAPRSSLVLRHTQQQVTNVIHNLVCFSDELSTVITLKVAAVVRRSYYVVHFL